MEMSLQVLPISDYQTYNTVKVGRQEQSRYVFDSIATQFDTHDPGLMQFKEEVTSFVTWAYPSLHGARR